MDFLNIEGFILIFPHIFYGLVSNALMMVEIFQFLFRKLAGLDTFYLNGEEIEKSGDLVLQIIKKTFFSGENNEYSVIAVTFWSIVIIASILLFVTTIAAIIRVEYSPNKVNPGESKSKGTSKGKILGNFFKAILSFVAVPIACYFGLYLGNAVLFAIDSATSSTTISFIQVDNDIYNKLKSENGTYVYNIFLSYDAVPANTIPIAGLANRLALYSANRTRNSKNYYETVILYESAEEGKTTNFDIFNMADNQNDAADLIDSLFAINARLKTPQALDGSKAPKSSIMWGTPTTEIEYFNRYNIGLVNYYYDLWKYNWILAIFFVIIIAKTMIGFTFGMIGRFFNLLALLMVGPLVMALMPIDGGSGLTSWGKNFVDKAIGAYTAVFSMNILFMIMPIFMTIKMFGPGFSGWSFIDLIIQMILIGAALLYVPKVDEIVAKSLHSSSIYEEGGKLSEQMRKTFWEPIQKASGKIQEAGYEMAKGIMTRGDSLAGANPRSFAGRLGSLLGAAIGRRRGGGGSNDGSGPDSGNGKKLSKRDLKRINQSTKTQSQIKEDALNKVDKNIEKEYDNNFSKLGNDAYKDYQNRGGNMSEQDFFDNTKKGTYIDADHQWGEMSNTDRKQYADKNDFLHKYYDIYNPNRVSEFSNWEEKGKNLQKSDKGIGNNNYTTYGDVQRQIGSKKAYVENRRQQVMEQLNNGIANIDDKIAKQAIRQMEKENQRAINARFKIVRNGKYNQAQQYLNMTPTEN